MKNRLYLTFLSAFFLIVPFALKAQFIQAVFKKTACNVCTGEARLTVNDLEILNSIRNNKFKFTLKMNNAQGAPIEIPQSNLGEAFSDRIIIFKNVCAGDFVIIAEFLDNRFAGLDCAKKEFPGRMEAEGEGNFTIELVSTRNESIEISTTAKNPRYQWSNGTANKNLQALANTAYFVTVTDDVGCTKVGGPYQLPDGCGEGMQYDFEPSVVGSRLYAAPGQTLQAKVKANGSSSFVDADASYTITWKDPAGNVLGTGPILPATLNLYQRFDFLTLEFANKCKKKIFSYELFKCGSTSSELNILFNATTTPSCADLDTKDIYGNSIDLKSGSLSLNLSSLNIPASKVSIKIDDKTYDDKRVISVNNLGAGPHQAEVTIEGVTPLEKCTYLLDLTVGETAFSVVSTPATKDGNCSFNLYCPTNKARPTFIVPAAREYTVELKRGEGKIKERNTMCRPMLDCVLGGQSFSVRDPRQSKVSAITSWAGILDEVFNTLLKDENSSLSDEQKIELRRLCEANTNRDKCTKVVFCPGSLTVIDDARPKKGFKENGDRTEDGCRIIDCGVGKAREERSSCDPEIAAIVDVDMPIGKDGISLCKKLPPPPKDQPCSSTSKATIQKIVTDYTQGIGLFDPSLNDTFNSSALVDLANELVNANNYWDMTTIGCREIHYCTSNYSIKNGIDVVLLELASIDFCRPCQSNPKIISFNEAISDPAISPLLREVYNQTNYARTIPFPQSGNGRYACMAVEYCESENRLMNIRALKREIDNAPICNQCDRNWKTERLNIMVQNFIDGTLVPTANSELYRILQSAKTNHNNFNNPRCKKVTYCTADFSVIKFSEVFNFASNAKCPDGDGPNSHLHGHEHEGYWPENIEPHDNVSSTTNAEEIEIQTKVFRDTIFSESFQRFAPLISEGGTVPKAITTSPKGNYYYNYSHADNNLNLFADSTLQYEWVSWDDNKTFTVYESALQREYALMYSGPEYAWSAFLESDTLLRVTHYSVKDSFLRHSPPPKPGNNIFLRRGRVG